MKILMICSTYTPIEGRRCGIGDYSRRLCLALNERGCSVDAFTSHRSGPQQIPENDLIRSFHSPMEWSLSSARRLLQFAHREAYSAIHWQYHPRLYGKGMGFHLLCGASRLSGPQIPVVLTLHTVKDSRWSAFVRTFISCRGGSFFLFTNEPDRHLWARRLRIPPMRTQICPVGPTIEPPKRRPDLEDLREHVHLKEDSFVVSHFGFINRGKGVETLLKAIALARSRIPGLVLLVAGQVREESKPQYDELNQLCVELGIQDIVKWLGDVPEAAVSCLMASAHVYAVPYTDGASTRRTTLISGLAHGATILTTSPPMSSLPLRPGHHVEWVNPGDHEAMANRLLELWSSPEKRDALSQAAREVSEQFSWSQIAARTMEIYERVSRSERTGSSS